MVFPLIVALLKIFAQYPGWDSQGPIFRINAASGDPEHGIGDIRSIYLKSIGFVQKLNSDGIRFFTAGAGCAPDVQMSRVFNMIQNKFTVPVFSEKKGVIGCHGVNEIFKLMGITPDE
jgi:hypothetical protein